MSQPKAPYSREDLEAWKVDPVTRWVLSALRNQAQACQAEWVNQTWGPQLSGPPGEADQRLLLELKVRADALMAVEESSYEDVCEANGEIPEPE